MKLELTEAALTDLRSIRRYTLKTWGKSQEENYVNLLWGKFGQILADPSRHRIRNDLFPRCQIAAVGKHVILFRIQSDTLQIVRVLHSAMDFRKHLPDVL